MDVKKKISLAFGTVSRVLFVPVCAAGAILAGAALAEHGRDDLPAYSSMTYILKEYDGKIGVFREGNTAPDEVLDVYLITLPDEDAALLRNGISVSGQDEVRALIEDFTG